MDDVEEVESKVPRVLEVRGTFHTTCVKPELFNKEK